MKTFTPLQQKLDLRQKRGETTPNQAKIQSTTIWLKFSGYPQPNERMGLMKKNVTPLSQNLILGRKGGGEHPKSGKNSTHSDFAQIFRVTPAQWKNGIGDEKIYPSQPKFEFCQKRGGTSNQAKFNHIWFCSNFQGNPSTMKEWDWGGKFFPAPSAKIRF